MKSTLLIVAGCVAGLGLLIGVPVGLKSYMDAAPKREAAAKRKAQMAELEKKVRANEEVLKAKRSAEEAQAMADFQAKSARIQEIYNTLKETAATQPTRPMADLQQLALEMHYLWLEVRNAEFWLLRPKERDEMDRMISAIVAAVEQDRKIRESFSN